MSGFIGFAAGMIFGGYAVLAFAAMAMRSLSVACTLTHNGRSITFGLH